VVPLRTLALLFLRLGLTSFGGPAAHIALLHYEVVVRRRWVSDAEFAELIALTNLIPGPNSTEMGIHIGRRVAGWPGFLIAGVCFILPAALMVAALAVAYVEYGRTPPVRTVMGGIAPVVIAIIAHATATIGRSTIRTLTGLIIAVGAGALALAGVNELLLLALAGAASGLSARALGWTIVLAAGPAAGAQGATAAAGVALSSLFLFFLKIGSILFGSGYVLVAFLRADLVERWGWLTDQQLLDAIAVGQFTPGPLFTTATFIGYVLRGPAGALLATIGIFLPAFVFVALTQPLLPALRRSALAQRFLHGVVAASIGLMAAVAVQLAATALRSAVPVLVAAAAFVTLARWRVNSVWLVLAGALLSWLLQ
jgi:chromate transporter